MQKVKVVAPAHGAYHATTAGSTISMQPFEERIVPIGRAPRYAQAGCLIVADGVAVEQDELDDGAPVGEERLAAILAAVAEILAAGKIEDFTGGGEIRVKAVSDVAGFRVQRDEVIRAMVELEGDEVSQ